MLEREGPLVFEPLNTVIGAKRAGIHHIAVGIQHVQFSVIIQIHQLDACRAVGRMRPRVNGLFAEVAVSIVQERDDGFVLLTD